MRTTAFVLSLSLAASFGFAVQLSAQKPEKKPVTVTGCLQRDTPAIPSGTSGVAGAPETTTTAGERFVLVKGGPVPPAAGTWHSSKNGGPWFLVEGNATELRRNTNHLVEVTGTVDTAGSVLGTSASATDGPSGTLHVERIRIVDASCSQ